MEFEKRMMLLSDHTQKVDSNSKPAKVGQFKAGLDSYKRSDGKRLDTSNKSRGELA